jgi:hypothetical protein
MTISSREIPWQCGWKNDKGEPQDETTLEATSPTVARHRYIRDILFDKYPQLSSFKVSSFYKLISVRQPGKEVRKGRPTKENIPDSRTFYDIINGTES